MVDPIAIPLPERSGDSCQSSLDALEAKLRTEGNDYKERRPQVIEADLNELENSIKHLDRSNVELEKALTESPDDHDFKQALSENQVALKVKRKRAEVMKRLLLGMGYSLPKQEGGATAGSGVGSGGSSSSSRSSSRIGMGLPGGMGGNEEEDVAGQSGTAGMGRTPEGGVML